MAFKFEKLKIWQIALELTVEIANLTKSFPKEERYNLTTQIKDAADSVVLNIAEGCTGQSNNEFKRFLRYALRSGIEVVACLFIACKKEYITEDEYKYFYSRYESLCKQITRMQQSLESP